MNSPSFDRKTDPTSPSLTLLSDHARGHTSPPRKTLQEELQRRFPFVEKWTEKVQRIPPRYKFGCVLLWFAWKAVLALAVLYFLSSSGTGTSSATLMSATTTQVSATTSSSQPPLRVLYIVTSLAEYNTGRRDTIKGQDRLSEVLLPILKDSVESILSLGKNVQVDVYLILAYTLLPAREQYIRDHLPTGVQIWDDACPTGYEKKHSKEELLDNTRALSRQHRYVIRDKFEHYDLFVAVEDDMRITGDHVHQFLQTSAALDGLRATTEQSSLFYGPLTQRQLDRLVPGFVRVEVLLDPETNGAQTKLDPIPLEYPNDQHFDPKYCCHVTPQEEFPHPQEYPLPLHPDAENVVIWETNVQALSVRKLPPNPVLDWIALLPGPGKRLDAEDLTTGYWSGHDGAFGINATKPSPGEPHLIAQQGGWMATPLQLVRLQRLCQGSFLPPFDEPVYKSDGQESMNVEFWSGGYQFFTGVRGGCNMQRVVSLKDKDQFSKHFIYHAANNKQRQLAKQRMVRADHLWGQLNAVKNAAERTQQKIIEHQDQEH
jgi:hypothetical protein